MEEAEVLCSRIGFIVDGRLKCLGDPQHLKNKFGGGYRVYFNHPPSAAASIKSFVDKVIPGAVRGGGWSSF